MLSLMNAVPQRLSLAIKTTYSRVYRKNNFDGLEDL
jgi:hypothetical protein